MIKAKGTSSPKIYVIAGHPNEEDMQKGYPLSGQDGQYLLRVLGAFVVSIVAIKFLLSYIKKNDFKLFGYYRIVLGALVLVYFAIFG